MMAQRKIVKEWKFWDSDTAKDPNRVLVIRKWDDGNMTSHWSTREGLANA